MQFHPTFIEFGELRLIEIYEYYDRPLLVLCENIVGRQFIALFVDEDPRSELWLYVEVSTNRLHLVRSGGIDLRSTFSQTEDNTVYVVNIPFDNSINATCERIRPNDLDPDLLPLAGEHLSVPTETLPKIQSDIEHKAAQANRAVARLRLNFANSLRTEAPAKVFGEILVAVQEIMYAIGQRQKEEQVSTHGAYPKSIIANSELAVSAMGAGSFEVELTSTQNVNLFGESDIQPALEELAELLEIGSDPDQLRAKLTYLQYRVSGRYYDFLEQISSYTKSIEMRWASPNKPVRRAEISGDTAAQAMGIIRQLEVTDKRTETLVGSLTGASLNSKTFEFSYNDILYKGKIHDDAVSQVDGAKIGETYRATFDITQKIKATTGEIPPPEYVLIGLEKI